MSSASNLYAEKVFAEHPIALWALDEPIDYVSIISEEQRDLFLWTATNAVVAPSTNKPNPPFLNSNTSYFLGEPNALFNTASFVSPTISNLNSLSKDMETMSIGAYIYADHDYVTGYEIGFRYTDPTTQTIKDVVRFFSAEIGKQWSFISETFLVPNVDSNFSIILRAKYSVDQLEPLPGYGFYVNGISVGQWSEQHSAVSLGVPLNLIESISNPIEAKAIKAGAYGSSSDFGYYTVSDNNMLYAKNVSIPMVYGSSSITKIVQNPSKPSLILPGRGFLNESGRYQEYTLEAWIRAKSTGNKLRRIIGPIDSEDGVYINGTFVTLVIANQVSSHFIGDWYRPMLLDLKVGIDYANLFINGEQVASVSFSTKDIPLPASNRDWIGFYAYDDVEFIELDAVGIYPYQIPSILLKRRFAFGQAVESPEGTNRAYGGVAAFIDYKFADYTSNYNYPKTGNWSQGISENLNTDNNRISPPSYSLPELILSSGTKEEWLAGQHVAENNTNSYLKFSNDNPGYFFLDDFNLSFQAIKGVYGIFEIDEYSNQDKTLIKIDNVATESHLKVSLNSEYILYRFKFWGEERTLYFKSGVSLNTKFFAGIDVDNLAEFFGEDVLSFFGNTSQLTMYVANEISLSSQFDGKIHKFGICSLRNISKIKDSFDNLEIDAVDLSADPGDVYFGNNLEFWQFFVDGGFVTSFEVDKALGHISSYTLVGRSNFGKTSLDLETDSYWEDYIPLSSFAQYVKDLFGNFYYDLDFLQFNINYPARQKFIANSYDTSEELVRTYVSFQYLSSGANAPEGAFALIEPMPKNGVIVPGDNWKTTKYEVVDGAIIYPPKDVNINDLAIVTYINLAVSGTSTSPVSIRSLEYASQAFNDQTPNPVKTKFGVDITPYTQFAALFDYKAPNPFKIYKGSTPHLYLTDDSGIQRVGRTDAIVPRGLSVPINSGSAPQYKLNAMQMFLFYNKDRFSSRAVQLFEIKGTDSIIRFYIKANDKSGKRARIYAINGNTATTEDGIAFFINGKIVREAIISLNEWTSLGIAFATPMSFDEYPGAIRVVDTFLFNNLSYYEASSLQEIQRQSRRTWSRLNSDNDSWLEVLRRSGSGNFLWNDVLVISTLSFFGINPGDIYKSYTGTNKIVVDGAQALKLGAARVTTFTDVNWTTNILTPV